MNSKGCGRKHNSRYYPRICKEGLRKTMKNFIQDIWSLGQDLNKRPPEYEAEVPTSQPRHSMRIY
jgi:hypothetical protein